MFHKYRQIILVAVLYLVIMLLPAWRLWCAVALHFPAAFPWYAVIYVILSLALPLGYALPKTRFSKILDMIGNYWYSLQLMLVFAALLEWLTGAVIVGLFRLPLQRQMNVFSLLVFGVTIVAFLYGAVHTRKIKVHEYDCPVSKVLPSGENLRIVHLSDIHLSSINDLHTVREIVSKVNSLSADYICITGDTFTQNTREVFEMDAISAEFRNLKSRYGTYTCLGNHDAGKELPKMKEFFRESGIMLLEDESIIQNGVCLLGRRDMTPGGNAACDRMPVKDCLKDISPEHLIVVMDHQPGDIENCAKAGVDILLSGHTHGGQFYPLNRLIHRIFPHYSGCKKFGEMYSIVSPGTSPVPYIRVIGDSEIIVVNVRSQESAV